MKEEDKSFSSSGWRVSMAHSISRYFRGSTFKGAGWIRANITRLLAGAPNSPIITPVEGNIKLLLDPGLDKGLESILYYHGSYELGTLDLISKCLSPGQAFLDVGANIGLFSIYMSRNCKDIRICSFEPLESTFKILEHNVEINNCTNIETFPIALGISNYTETIGENLDVSRGSASMVDTGQSGYYQHKVQVLTLNEFVKNEGVENIGLIKIDVEGWEQHILLGARDQLNKKDGPIWVIEHNSTQKTEGATPEDVYKFIIGTTGYKAFKSTLGKQMISPLVPLKDAADLPENDNLFYFLDYHLEQLPASMFL